MRYSQSCLVLPGRDANGVIEIGYSVLPEWQRRGYAREIVKALLTHAYTIEDVTKVIAQLGSSIQVLTLSFHRFLNLRQP